MTPEVTQKLTSRNTSFAKCPMCTTSVRIARDASAWIRHMVGTHSATENTFASNSDIGKRAFEKGLIDSESVIYKFPHKCYGCGASFSTSALLVTHLTGKHDAI